MKWLAVALSLGLSSVTADEQEFEIIAAQRQFLFVNVHEEFLENLNPGFSSNGVHLTGADHEKLAQIIATELDFPQQGFQQSELLREAIFRKNRYWQQFYHPTNWAFLFGDRQHVPASRDHIDTEKRWFVDELNSLPAMIRSRKKTRLARPMDPPPGTAIAFRKRA